MLEDLQVAQDLLDTLIANKEGCVGMAANMLGVRKGVIAFDNEVVDNNSVSCLEYYLYIALILHFKSFFTCIYCRAVL